MLSSSHSFGLLFVRALAACPASLFILFLPQPRRSVHIWICWISDFPPVSSFIIYHFTIYHHSDHPPSFLRDCVYTVWRNLCLWSSRYCYCPAGSSCLRLLVFLHSGFRSMCLCILCGRAHCKNEHLYWHLASSHPVFTLWTRCCLEYFFFFFLMCQMDPFLCHIGKSKSTQRMQNKQIWIYLPHQAFAHSECSHLVVYHFKYNVAWKITFETHLVMWLDEVTGHISVK